jgi:hypothetical protein
MTARPPDGRILAVTAAEEQLSPELVLVLPPEEARRARERLPEPAVAAPPLRRKPARLGSILFALGCLANCAIPTALLLAAR